MPEQTTEDGCKGPPQSVSQGLFLHLNPYSVIVYLHLHQSLCELDSDLADCNDFGVDGLLFLGKRNLSCMHIFFRCSPSKFVSGARQLLPRTTNNPYGTSICSARARHNIMAHI